MVDARGFVCPMPALMVQKAIAKDAPSTLEVLVDESCAVENITRLATSNGYSVEVKKEHGDYLMKLTK